MSEYEDDDSEKAPKGSDTQCIENENYLEEEQKPQEETSSNKGRRRKSTASYATSQVGEN